MHSSDPRHSCLAVAAGAAVALLLGTPELATAAAASSPMARTEAAGTLVLVDRTLHFQDGMRVRAQSGILLVSENRADPAARTIPVHFWRIPASRPGRPPLFYLPGGPGDNINDGIEGSPEYSGYGAVEGPWTQRLLELTQGRSDIIFVSQRGNPGAQMTSSLGLDHPGLPLDKVTTASEEMKIARDAVARAQSELAAYGADLAGYDILNAVEDIEELRLALGYGKLMLGGGSFGSQWSFAYMRRHPQNVDRAMLDGVEPLAFTYDSPASVDRALMRVLAAADAAPELVPIRPAGGFTAAFQRVMASLLRAPAEALVDGKTVVVSRTDFARLIRNFSGPLPLRDVNALFPELVAEADRGEFTRAAAITAGSRNAQRQTLIGPLIDSSIGISPPLDRQFQQEGRTAHVGDVNLDYRAFRDIIATKKMPDTFRAFVKTDIPVLLIQGDMDFYTPVENAEEAILHLPNGTLLRVSGGTHNVANELVELAPREVPVLQAFLAGSTIAPGTRPIVLPPLWRGPRAVANK